MRARIFAGMIVVVGCAVGSGTEGIDAATFASGDPTPPSDDDGSSSSSSSGAPEGESSGDAESSGGSSEGATAVESSSGDPSVTDSSPETSGSDTGDTLCTIGADDDECGVCVKTKCCNELSACWEDAGCVCVASCVASSMEPDPVTAAVACAGPEACNVPLEPITAILETLNACVSATCPHSCGAPA